MKRQIVKQLSKGGRSRLIWWFLVAAVFVVWEGPALAAAGGKAEDRPVSYPAALFADGKAKYFQYRTADGVVIRYFLLRSADGVVRAAFDACDVCWPEGKGYSQRGDSMVCNNCGRAFSSTRINVVSGGCNPAPLRREVVGQTLVIKVRDILDGRRYFTVVRR